MHNAAQRSIKNALPNPRKVTKLISSNHYHSALFQRKRYYGALNRAEAMYPFCPLAQNVHEIKEILQISACFLQTD